MKDYSKQNSEKKDIHQTIEPHQTSSLDSDRKSFNDVIKHGDIVNGFQSPKKIEQIPKWYQKPFKIITTISIFGLISMILYQFIRTIILIISNK